MRKGNDCIRGKALSSLHGILRIGLQVNFINSIEGINLTCNPMHGYDDRSSLSPRIPHYNTLALKATGVL